MDDIVEFSCCKLYVLYLTMIGEEGDYIFMILELSFDNLYNVKSNEI